MVDHACSARRQTKNSGPGLVPVCTCPCSWGEGGVRPPPLPSRVCLAASPKAHGAPGVLSGLPWAVQGCPLLVLVLLWRWHCGWCCCGFSGVWRGGGGSVPSGVSVVVGDVASHGTGNQINPNIQVMTGLRPPSVTLSPGLQLTCGLVAANISAPPLFNPPQLTMATCGCCGVWYGKTFPLLLFVLMSVRFHSQFSCYDVCEVRLCQESHWVVHYEMYPFSHNKHFQCPYPFLRCPHTGYHYCTG